MHQRASQSTFGTILGTVHDASDAVIPGATVTLELSMEAANVFNHRNYEPPNMQLDSGAFGAIPELQTAEGAGPRNLQLSGRITF